MTRLIGRAWVPMVVVAVGVYSDAVRGAGCQLPALKARNESKPLGRLADSQRRCR
jgi:hypothetical protein